MKATWPLMAAPLAFVVGCSGSDGALTPSDTSTLVCSSSARMTSTEQAVRFEAIGGFGQTFGYRWDLGAQGGESIQFTGQSNVVIWHTPGAKHVTVSDSVRTADCLPVEVVRP